MRFKYLIVLTLTAILQGCFAPPVSPNKKEDPKEADSEVTGLEDYMEYHRYLKEVVSALESDPEFRQKLEKADENEIKSGKIADELEFVSHSVRTKLDEIKRLELQRLKELIEKKRKLENQIDDVEDPVHHHLDHTNPHTFEIEDLKKLIAKTTHDLEVADKARKEEFKQYEMEKEYQKIDKLNHTNGDAERELLEKQFKEREEKHKKHEKLHEPGHKAQLEEVWEEQDQMQQDFDPKTFFMLHDLDGNGFWDQDEVKTLFIRELDKVYQQGMPEDDMRERIEEMERMRESMFAEMDFNRDGFIDYKEFLQQTSTNDFKQDHGWQTLDEQTKPYSPEELEEYIRQAHMDNRVLQGRQPHPNQGYQKQQQFQPGQVPQMAPQQLDLNMNEVHDGQQQPQYMPPNQYQQIPPQNQQVPPQYHQVPPQNQQVPPQNQQVPPKNQQGPPQNQQVPPQYQQVPPQNQQVPPQYQQVPAQNQQVPPQNQQYPQQVPPQNPQVQPKNPQQVLPPNQQIPSQNRPHQYQEIPISN